MFSVTPETSVRFLEINNRRGDPYFSVDAVEVNLHIRLFEVVVNFLPEGELRRVQPVLALVDFDQLGEDCLDFVKGGAGDLGELGVFPILKE